VMSFEIPKFSLSSCPLVRTNFKTEHFTVIWSQVLYRSRLFPPEG
jgi:hypothetical protein